MTDLKVQDQLIFANYNLKTRKLVSIDNSLSTNPIIPCPLNEPSYSSIDQINPNFDLVENCNEILEVGPYFIDPVPICNLSELLYRPSSFLGPQPLLYLTVNIQGQQIKANRA